MLRHRHHLILLCPLILVAFISNSQQIRRDTVIVHFAFDSYRIRAADSIRLREIFDKLSADLVLIKGYTDKTGTAAYNQRLSERRALAALDCIRHGRRHVSGEGVAPTPELPDSENRRVEIIYTSKISTERINAESTASVHDTLRRNIPLVATARRRNDSIVTIKNSPVDSATADSTQPSAVLALHHINFIVDTPVPTDSTRAILPRFLTELRQFKDHHLEIDGYVNSIVPLRGPNDPLFKLSVNRARFIYDYLVEAGFDPAMLTYKGMGNASPINPHPTTKQEMNANMRVEIRVF